MIRSTARGPAGRWRWACLLVSVGLLAVAVPAQLTRGIQGTGSIFDDPEPGTRPAPRPRPPAPRPQPPKPGEPPAPAPPAVAADEVAAGLVAEAFDGVGFAKQRERRVTRNISVTFRRNAAAAKPSETAPLSFRWSGMVKVPQAWKYHFQVPLACDATVQVGGKTVLRQTRAQAADGRFPVGQVELPEGYQDLKVEISNVALAGDVVKVQVLFGVGEAPRMEQLPASVLFHKSSEEGDGGVQITWGGGDTKPPQTGTRPQPGTAAQPGTGAPRPPAPRTVEAPPPPARVAVPPEAAVNDARKAARTKYATYYAEKKPAIQLSLVKKLTADADAATGPADKYGLLREAAEVAAGAGELDEALAAVKKTAQNFQSDETELAITTLAAAQRGMNKDNASAWAEQLLRLADEASNTTRYDLASKAVTLADAAAKAMPGGAGAGVAARAKEKANALRDLRAEQAKLATMFEKLKTKPDDPEANLRVGKFYCLVAADWARGLSAVAKGSDLELQALGELETAAQRSEKAGERVDVEQRIKLGDLWYARAANEPKPYNARCKQRAAYWYKPAIAAATEQDTKDRLWDRCAESQGVINLLGLVDLKRHVVQGNRWEWRGKDLWCEGRGPNAVQFPHKPAAEYNYLVEFTVTAGDGVFHHIIPAGNSTATWALTTTSKYWQSGFGSSKLPGGSVPKQRHTSLIKVRKNLIRVYYDGQLASEWERDASRLGGGFDGLPNAALGVGCLHTTIVVHSAQLTEVRDDDSSASADATGNAPGNGNTGVNGNGAGSGNGPAIRGTAPGRGRGPGGPPNTGPRAPAGTPPAARP